MAMVARFRATASQVLQRLARRNPVSSHRNIPSGLRWQQSVQRLVPSRGLENEVRVGFGLSGINPMSEAGNYRFGGFLSG
jgi:hypothetical protein